MDSRFAVCCPGQLLHIVICEDKKNKTSTSMQHTVSSQLRSSVILVSQASYTALGAAFGMFCGSI